MTTATHSLGAASGATTVADLLARHGARADRPHRRSRAVDGRFGGALPVFPADDAPTAQYRYDKSTVTALLAVTPAVETPPAAETSSVAAPPAEAPQAEKPRSGRTGLKIAGLAFAGAVLASGWALAQQPGAHDATAAGPLPSNNTPESDSPLLASAPVGAQVATLVTSFPAGTSALPSAPAPVVAQQPDQGKFSGKLPSTTTQSTPAAPAPSQTVAPQVPAPRLPAGTYTWPTTADKQQKQNDHRTGPGGDHRHGGDNDHGGGRHRR